MPRVGFCLVASWLQCVHYGKVLVDAGDQDKVDQKGSEVTSDKLRFDFTCSRGIQVRGLRKLCNAI